MDVEILHYRSLLAYNREVFLIEHPDLIKAFATLDENFDAIFHLPKTLHDPDGHTHISLLPFLLLIQRQARAAFEFFSTAQCYNGWVVVRPGLEAALIVGKWLDNAQNADIWSARNDDPNTYSKTYSGKALRSKSLPRSDRLQATLSRINDGYVHANPDYYSRHLGTDHNDPDTVTISINYFDESPLQTTHTLAFLHLLITLQDSLMDMFNSLFAVSNVLPSTLAMFMESYETALKNTADTHAELRDILSDLGAWDATA